MSHFDDFFRANYLGMVRYCGAFGHTTQDVEEVVADVILKHYDEYLGLIDSPTPLVTMRHWMNRRALLNLKDRQIKHYRSKTVSSEDPESEAGLTFDDPESLLQLKQSLPPVHPILISYEAFGKANDRNSKRGGLGENTSADKTKFCRERKKFMEALRK